MMENPRDKPKIPLFKIEELQKAVKVLNDKIEQLKNYPHENENTEDTNKNNDSSSSSSSGLSTGNTSSPSTPVNQTSNTESKSEITSPENSNDSKSPPSIEFGIFVSDIARGVTDEQLQAAFSKIGQVYEATVVKNKFTGETKGYGFVRFFDMETVYKALDLKELPSFEDSISKKIQNVKIQYADPKNSLYLNNLPKDITNKDLQTQITDLGNETPTKFDLYFNPDGKCKGYGWVSYKDHEGALRAMKNLQQVLMQGHPISVSLAQPKAIDRRLLSNTKILFVKGIKENATESSLTKLFGEGVEKIVLPLDQANRKRLGHAFVHFKTREEAEVVKKKFDGQVVEDMNFVIEWCIPQNTKKKMNKKPKNKAKSKSVQNPKPDIYYSEPPKREPPYYPDKSHYRRSTSTYAHPPRSRSPSPDYRDQRSHNTRYPDQRYVPRDRKSFYPY